MRRAALPVLSLALVFCLSNAYDQNNGAAAMRMRYRDSAAGTLAKRRQREATPSTSFHLSDGSLADVRRRVRTEAAGTYIGDILHERDSALARWPDRKGVPLTVWVQPTSTVRDFSIAYVDRVRNAFQEWDDLQDRKSVV